MWFCDGVPPDRRWILPCVREVSHHDQGGPRPAGAPRPVPRSDAGDLAAAQGIGVASAISLALWTLTFLVVRYAV